MMISELTSEEYVITINKSQDNSTGNISQKEQKPHSPHDMSHHKLSTGIIN